MTCFSPLLLLLLIPVAATALLLLILSIIVRPRPVNIPIKGRHIFITGGSTGIGLAIARQAASDGAARVSILSRSRAKLDEAREEIIRSAKSAGSTVEVSVYSLDVRDEEGCRKAVEAAPIDVLVLNQAAFLPCEIEKQSMEDIRFTMEVNLIANYHLIKSALPGMRSGGGAAGPRSITMVSSQAAQVGIYGYTSHSASKAALRGLAEALQMEVINDDIHVSLVFPPDTETPGLMIERQTRPELTKIIAKSSTLMKADEVARKTLNGIKCGSFIITCNLEGIILSLSTAGAYPQRSCLTAFAEVVGAGFMRLLALFFLYSWYNAIDKYHAKKKRN